MKLNVGASQTSFKVYWHDLYEVQSFAELYVIEYKVYLY